MGKLVHLVLAAVLCCMLGACGGTEIEKNPAPIVWGQISFFPAIIERSHGKVVWNDVKFSGYGKSGTISKVIITDNETIVENINSDFYSAKRQTWKGVSGEYQEALEYLVSEKYQQAHDLSTLPKVRVESYQAEDEAWKDSRNNVSMAQTSIKDLSFTGFSDWTSAKVKIQGYRELPVNIGKASVGRLFLPDDFEDNPEGIILEKLNLEEITVPVLNIKMEKFYLDYKAPKLEFALNNASVPGATLALLGIPNAPEMIRGSMYGEGELQGNLVSAEANANFPELFQASAELRGAIAARYPEMLKFTLKDEGLLKYINNEQKSQLALLAMLVPNGQEAIIGFLSKPGQTLDGALDARGGTPDFKFTLK